jgi:CheY-like chemotaxis protein
VPQSILLVDDEFSSLEVLALLLGQEGFEVVTASDGEEALSRLEKRVDLVITDYWMPKMNGLELVERMQADERWRAIPVLLMTATYDSDGAAHPALAGIMPKPLRYGALLAEVRRLLAGKPPQTS